MKINKNVRTALCAAITLFAASGFLRAAPADTGSVQTLQEIVVTGERVGPRMWKVSKGDHVLWLLGTPPLLPKGVSWRSEDVERAVEESQQVVVGFTVQPNINLFNILPLYLQYRRVIQLPAGHTLRDWLTPSLYARYAAVKAKYLPKDEDLDRRRPMFALTALGLAARDAAGLDDHIDVTAEVLKMARKHKIGVVRHTTRMDDPKEILREVAAMPRDAELSCFAAGLDTLASDVKTTKANANVWALGDVATLRRLESELKISELRDACEKIIINTPALRGALDQARQLWQAAAEHALEANTSTVALANIEELLRQNGVLDRFRADGFEVAGP
jgi:uncharacterized protein YbaP (TraB family)